MTVGVTTAGYVVLGVFGAVILVTLFMAGQLFWRLMQGDEQIESTSWGKQFFGRRRREN